MSDTPFDIFGLGASEGHDPIRKAQELSAPKLMKRFYEQVSVEEGEGGFSLFLDGRIVKTPAKLPFTVNVRGVAEAAAEEWRAQDDVINPKYMPVTRMVNSALDGVANKMAEVRAEIVRYVRSDLLCYRAEQPERLVARQATAWDSVLGFAEERYGIKLHLAKGIIYEEQPDESVKAFADILERENAALVLAGFHTVTSMTGSCLLALMIYDGLLSVDDAWAAAHVDEDWTIEQWGEDEEAKMRRALRYEDMKAACLLLTTRV